MLRISDKGYLQSRSCKTSQDMGDIYGAVQNVFQILQLTPPSGGFFPGRFGVEVASSNDLTPSYRFIAAVHSDADRTVGHIVLPCLAVFQVSNLGVTSGSLIYRTISLKLFCLCSFWFEDFEDLISSIFGILCWVVDNP